MKKKEKVVDTEPYFKYFCDECRYWIKYWGLSQWEVFYLLTNDDDSARATCESNIHNKIATITLQQDWDSDAMLICNHMIAKCAFHEVDELRYSGITNLLYTFFSEPIAESMVHEMIRTEENTIFKDYWGERDKDGKLIQSRTQGKLRKVSRKLPKDQVE